MRIDGVYVGLGEGDESDEVGKIIDYVRKMYTPARNNVPAGRLFTPELTAEIKREQQVFVGQGKLKAGEFIPGVINLAWKYASGYLKKDMLLPLYFSAEGHMSDMNIGPVAHIGQVLHNEGRALHFPTWYVNNTIPFKTRTGITELARRVGQTMQDNGVKFPEGTPWGMGGFSEGGLLISKFYLEYLQPGKPLHWRLKDLRGVVCCGSPYREKGVVAEWVPDPPGPDRQGISDVRLTNTPSWWKEVARRGDLYTDNQSGDDERGLYKTMCYKIIAEGSFSGGKAGFLARVIDLLQPTDDLIPVALAIFDGLKFVTNMSPHGAYDMAPAVQFMRERLAA